MCSYHKHGAEEVRSVLHLTIIPVMREIRPERENTNWTQMDNSTVAAKGLSGRARARR